MGLRTKFNKNPDDQSQSLASLLIRLWNKLRDRRKLHFIALIFLMPLGGLAEAVSLGAVLPFLGALIDPEKIIKDPIVATILNSLGVAVTSQSLVLMMLLLFIFCAILSALIRSLILWLSTRLAFACGSELSIEIYRRTLYQPYITHIGRHSSKVISGIINKVGACVNVLQQVITLINMSLMVVIILIAMTVINWTVALITGLGFGISYGIVMLICKSRLKVNGNRIARELENLHKSLQEGLGSIREVLLEGTQQIYCDNFRSADQPLRKAQGMIALISGIPRFAMESIGIILISILAYWMSTQPGGLSDALPVLGGIALCAQRLLPSIQQSFQAYSTIVATKQSLSDALNLLDQPIRSYISNINTLDIRSFKSIKLNYVSFQYGPTSPFVFKDACIEIKKGERIGIVGPTGSGKSTLLDIVMGLLRPTDGHLMLDEQSIDDDFVNAWQKNVAHVPQNIYLMDSSLAENIAFGIPKSKIDMNRVIRAAEQAQIADFIDRLPQKYQTFAGERGIRFSGGQKQRIGIARALYKQASILILDEATSSLDAVTEQSVMDAIDGLDNEFTVLIVAHRLSTLSSCDKIFKVELGKITMSTPRKEKPKLMDSN